MKKYSALFMAVMILCVMASGAQAYMHVTVNAFTDACYVGGEESTIVNLLANPVTGTN